MKVALVVLTSMLFLFSLGSAFAEAPWEFLRPVVEAANAWSPVIIGIVLVISAFLFVIAFLAYKKTKSKKLLWILAAFGLFVLKRVLYFIDLYFSPGIFMNLAVESVFDLLILASIFMAIFRK